MIKCSVFVLGTCVQYIFVIVENSNLIPQNNWINVQNFLINVVTIIAEKTDLGNTARLGVLVYSSQSQTAISIRNYYGKDQLVELIRGLRRNSRDSGASGLLQALNDVTNILQLFNSGNNSAVVVFKYSQSNEDQNSEQRLYELMFRQVASFVIGTNKFIISVRHVLMTLLCSTIIKNT